MDKHLTSMDIKDPGLRSLPLGVERYLVKGGGLSVITLDPDDKIEITDTEGKQKCEIIVFNKDGKPDCSLLGLKEKNDPKKIVHQMAEAGFAIGLVDPESTPLDSEKRNLPTLLRMAPHYYNTEDEILKAVKELSLLLSTPWL